MELRLTDPAYASLSDSDVIKQFHSQHASDDNISNVYNAFGVEQPSQLDELKTTQGYENLDDYEAVEKLFHETSNDTDNIEEAYTAFGLEPKPSILEEFGRGIEYGWGSTKALVADAGGAWVGSLIGDEEMKQRNLHEYMLAIEDLDRRVGGTVGSYKDVDSLEDGIRYAMHGVGQGLPSILPSLATGGVGYFTASSIGKYAIGKAGKRVAGEVAEGMVSKAIQRAAIMNPQTGSIVGSLMGAGSQNIPESYVNLLDSDVDNAALAFAYGSLKSSLDVLPQLQILDKFLPSNAPKEARGAFIDAVTGEGLKKALGGTLKGRLLSEGLISGGQEGITEALQQAIDIQARAFVDENISLFSPESIDQLIESFIQGSMVGTVMGSGSEGVKTLIDGSSISIGGRTHATHSVEESGKRIGDASEAASDMQGELFVTKDIDDIGRYDEESHVTLGQLRKKKGEDALTYTNKAGKKVNIQQDIKGRMNKYGYTTAQANMLAAIDPEHSGDKPNDSILSLGMLMHLYPEGVPQSIVNLVLPESDTNFGALDNSLKLGLASNVINREFGSNKSYTYPEYKKVLSESEGGKAYLESFDTLFKPKEGKAGSWTKEEVIKDITKERNQLVPAEQKAKKHKWANEPRDSRVVNKEIMSGKAINMKIAREYASGTTLKGTKKVASMFDSNKKLSKLYNGVFGYGKTKVDVINTLLQRSLLNTSLQFKNGKYTSSSAKQAWHYLRHGSPYTELATNKALSSQESTEAILEAHNTFDNDNQVQNVSDAEENLFHRFVEYHSQLGNPEEAVKAGRNLAALIDALEANKHTRKLLKMFDKALDDIKLTAEALTKADIKDEAQLFGKGGKPLMAFENAMAKERRHMVANIDASKKLARDMKKVSAVLSEMASTKYSELEGTPKNISATNLFSATAASNADKNPAFAVVQITMERYEEKKNSLLEAVTKAYGEISKERLPNLATSLDFLMGQRDRGTQIHVDEEGNIIYKDEDGSLKQLSGKHQITKDIITIRDALSHELDMLIDMHRNMLGKLGFDPDMDLAKLESLYDKLMFEQTDKHSMDIADVTSISANVKGLGKAIVALKELEGNKNSEYAPAVRFGEHAVFVHETVKDTKGNVKRDKSGKPERGELVYMGTMERYDTFGKFQKNPFTGEDRFDKTQKQDIKDALDAKYRSEEDYIISGENKPIKLTSEKIAASLGSSGVDTLNTLLEMVKESIDPAEAEKLKTKVATLIQADKEASKIIRTGSRRIDGYSRDWNRVLPQHHVGLSRRMANSIFEENFGRMEKYLNAVVASDDFDKPTTDYMRNYYEYVKSPLGDHVWLRKANFMLALGGNLSTALLQVFNLPLATFPSLINMGVSSGRAASIIAKNTTKLATPAVFRGLKKLSVKNKDINVLHDTEYFDTLVKDGVIEQHHSNMLKKAVERGILNPQIFESHSENVSFDTRGTKGAAKNNYEKMLKYAGMGIGAMEQLSRISTLSSIYEAMEDPAVFERTKANLEARPTYKEFRKQTSRKDLSDRELMTFFLLKDTHGRFDKSGRGFLQKGIMGSVVTPFVTHPITQLELLGNFARNAKDPAARAAMIWMLGGYFMLSGMAGAIPGEEVAEELYEMVHDLVGGVGTDLRMDVRKFFVDEMGFTPRLALMMTNGVAAAFLGTDTSTRITLPLGSTQPLTILMRTLRGDEKAITRAGGPTVGILSSSVDALNQIASGQSPLRATRNATPIALRNIIKAVWDYGEGGMGERTRAGVQVMNPEQLTMMDRFKKGIGFTPTKVTEARAGAYAESLAMTGDDRIRERFVVELTDIKFDAKMEYKKNGYTEKYKRLMKEYGAVKRQMKSSFKEKGLHYTDPKSAVNGRLKNRLDPIKTKARRGKTKAQKKLGIDRYIVTD